MLWAICDTCVEYLFLTPGLWLVHITGVILWYQVNNVTIPAHRAVAPVIAVELILVLAWCCDCLGTFSTVPIGVICLSIFTYWTRIGKLTIKYRASFIAGISLLAFCSIIFEYQGKVSYGYKTVIFCSNTNGRKTRSFAIMVL